MDGHEPIRVPVAATREGKAIVRAREDLAPVPVARSRARDSRRLGGTRAIRISGVSNPPLPYRVAFFMWFGPVRLASYTFYRGLAEVLVNFDASARCA